MRRHVRNAHVAPAAQPRSRPTAVAGGSPVEILRESLDALRAMATAGLSPAAQVFRIDAVRRAAETLGKLEPAPRSNVMRLAMRLLRPWLCSS